MFSRGYAAAAVAYLASTCLYQVQAFTNNGEFHWLTSSSSSSSSLVAFGGVMFYENLPMMSFWGDGMDCLFRSAFCSFAKVSFRKIYFRRVWVKPFLPTGRTTVCSGVEMSFLMRFPLPFSRRDPDSVFRAFRWLENFGFHVVLIRPHQKFKTGISLPYLFWFPGFL